MKVFPFPTVRAKLKTVCAIQKVYFKESGNDIARRNLKLMRTAGLAGLALYALYLAVTLLFFRDMEISPVYGFIVPILLFFLLYANRALRAETVYPRRVQQATLLLYALLMAYMLIMSVFPHPDLPSVYYPLFLLMAPVLFILPTCWHLLINVSSLIAFYILVPQFKSIAFQCHDLFEATTAGVLSIVVIIFMTQYRVQSDSLKDKYLQLSRQDPLTGVVNKTAGIEAAQAYLDCSGENDTSALFFIDIDDFKKYNDTCGHLMGDEMLRQIGAALCALCRKDDIACRFGGDEFILLLKNIRLKAVAEQRARSIVDAIARLSVGGQAIACSVGICLCKKGDRDVETLLHKADIALYNAKSNGKNQFCTYDEPANGVPEGTVR